jgi:hypothetical protein
VNLSRLAIAATVFIAIGSADEASDREKLLGEWHSQAQAGTDAEEVWILNKKDDGIHVTQSRRGEKVADFECNTVGRDCDVKASGHSGKVSFWFNGPKLVEMETRGSEVVKRLFSVAGHGDSLEIEVIPIAPGGQPKSFQYKRANPPVAQSAR